VNVVVIGAGLLGVSTAYFLARNGHTVTVLDAEAGPGRGASYANAALLAPSHAMPWSEPRTLRRVLCGIGRRDAALRLHARGLPSLLQWGLHFVRNSGVEAFERGFVANLHLARYAREVMDDLDASERLRYSREVRGTLTVMRARQSLDEIAGLSRWWDAMGVRHQALDAGQVVAREPALAPLVDEIRAGILNPDDGHGDAHAFCEQLAVHAARLGVEFRFGVKAERLVCDADRVRAVRIASMMQNAGASRTAHDELRAHRFVLAAGCASVALARQAGVRLPVVPIKGASITVENTEDADVPRLPVLDHEASVAIVPLGGRLRVAGGAEFAGLDTRVDAKRSASLQHLFATLFPRASETTDLHQRSHWVGLRPASVDGVPFIGSTALENLYLNTGHGHLGWTLAAGSSRALADLISGRRPDIDLAPYRLDRL
jgi:D-amino-acid dehydrogenase